MEIRLPMGCTWQSPFSELERALFPQSPELADLIGNLMDREGTESALNDALYVAAGNCGDASDALNDAAEAMRTAADMLFELQPARGKLREALAAVIQQLEDAELNACEKAELADMAKRLARNATTE